MSDTISAVYFQRSKAVHEEFKLIEAATEREVVVAKLQKIIRNVKEKRSEMVDEVILDSFRLLNELREVTMKLIKAIKAWQDSFTRPVRPTIYNCDYIIDRMIKYVDFVNGSKVRKIFNFQFLRGNPLLLPFPNLKGGDPIKVHSALAKEIRTFANPDEERVIDCYQFLINCLPPDVYNDKLVSLQKWLIEPWTPRIFATNNISVPCFPSNKEQIQMALQKEYGNRTGGSTNDNTTRPQSGTRERPQSGTRERPQPGARERRDSVTSRSSKTSNTSSKDSHSELVRKLLPPVTAVPITRRRVGAQPVAETSQAGKVKEVSLNNRSASIDEDSVDPLLYELNSISIGKGSKASSSNNNSHAKPIMRRNMMVHRDQQQALAVITGDADLVSLDSSQNSDTSEKNEKAKLSDTQLAQMQQLDLYYKELEGMFLPKFGRRAVQTILAGGKRQGGDNNQNYSDNNDENEGKEFQYRTKRAFSMFTSKAFEKRIDEAEQALRTEDFIRTDGQLIQKRNRILEQRGKGDGDNHRSQTGNALGSIPEQSSVGRRRGVGAQSNDDSEEEDEDEEDENDDEEEDDEGDEDQSPGGLSRSPALKKRQRSRRRSSVSFSLQVESFDRAEGVHPPGGSVGGRPRGDSHGSGSSNQSQSLRHGGHGQGQSRSISPASPQQRTKSSTENQSNNHRKEDKRGSALPSSKIGISRSSSGSSLPIVNRSTEKGASTEQPKGRSASTRRDGIMLSKR